MDAIILIILVLIFLAVIYFIYLQKTAKPNEIDLSKAIDTLVKQSNDKLNDKNLQIQTDLSNKKDAIEKMIKQVQDQLTTVEKERVGS